VNYVVFFPNTFFFHSPFGSWRHAVVLVGTVQVIEFRERGNKKKPYAALIGNTLVRFAFSSKKQPPTQIKLHRGKFCGFRFVGALVNVVPIVVVVAVGLGRRPQSFQGLLCPSFFFLVGILRLFFLKILDMQHFISV